MLAACPLFEGLAPAVLIRLAERAHATELAPGEGRTTEHTVWVVARGTLAVATRDGDATGVRRHGAPVLARQALGMIRVVHPTTPIVELVAEAPSVLVGVGLDDVRDVLEEDTSALTALAARIADLLLGDAT